MYSKQKMESIKESAYFDYFKFFTLNAAETIRKLETTFKEEISEDVFFDANHMFKRVKTLLSSYEILLMQIKDSCEFVEIPEFGVCIMKIFFQLMSIIKFMGKSIILRSGIDKGGPSQKEKRADQRHTMISTSPSEFYQNNIKPVSQTQERENFRMKEMASHIFKDIKQQVANLEKEHKNDSLENAKDYEKLSKGREKLQEIQSSQSQAVLSQTVNMLVKKSQHINSFINIVQTNIALQSKENNVETYLKIKEQFEDECVPRFESAKDKLTKLFREHVISYEQKKKRLMVSQECQVKIEDEDAVEERSKSSFHSNKKNHNNSDQIKKLKNEIKATEEQNKTLKAFIQQKCEEYENIITKIRAQKFHLDRQSGIDLKASFTDKYKSSNSKKSESYIENVEYTDNISQAQSHVSVESQNKDFFHTFDNPSKRSRVIMNSNRINKSKVKFNFNDKSSSLAIYSRVVNQLISNDEKTREIVVKNQKISMESKGTQFEKIQEHSSEHQSSFRDNSIQISETANIKQSKFKAKKERTSLMIFNDMKENKEMIQTDSCFGRSKKNFHPVCSIVAKKLMSRKESEQQREEDGRLATIKNVNSAHTLQKKPSKANESQKNLGKLSIFRKLDRQVDKKQQNAQEAETGEVLLPSYPKKLRYIKLMQGIEIIDLQSIISFDKSDLSNLFLSQENAHNYEILNITLLSKNGHYFSMSHNKNIVIKDIPKSSNNSKNSSYKNLSPMYQQKEETASIGDVLTNILYRYLKFLKQAKKEQKNYHIIKNFIRFPNSSVHRKNEKEWKQYEGESNVIEFLELKKYIARIIKLHYNCKNSYSESPYSGLDSPPSSHKINEQPYLCDHLRVFLYKIGVVLTEVE